MQPEGGGSQRHLAQFVFVLWFDHVGIDAKLIAQQLVRLLARTREHDYGHALQHEMRSALPEHLQPAFCS